MENEEEKAKLLKTEVNLEQMQTEGENGKERLRWEFESPFLQSPLVR